MPANQILNFLVPAILIVFVLSLWARFRHIFIALKHSQPDKKWRNLFSWSRVYENNERYTEEGARKGKALVRFNTSLGAMLIIGWAGLMFFIMSSGKGAAQLLTSLPIYIFLGWAMAGIAGVSFYHRPESRALRGLNYFMRPIKSFKAFKKAVRPWEKLFFYTGFALFLGGIILSIAYNSLISSN